MREAADREDKIEKSAVTPVRWRRRASCSARCCSQLNQPAEALAAFETTLKKEPNRSRALAGAVEAAPPLSGRTRRRCAVLPGPCPGSGEG